MNGFTKLCGIAAGVAATALFSFQDEMAMTMGIAALAAVGFIAVTVLVGAAVATRQPRSAPEAGRASVMDATPVISPLQEQ